MLELNEIHNPFPGIRPFEMDDTNFFFGRDGQSDELLKRMQRTRLLAIVGTSGSGKSSLIRAGLLPALYGGLMGDAGSSWRIAIHRPGGDPIGNLAIALADPLVFGSESDSEIQTALLETTLRRSSIGLIDVARQAKMSEHENLMVVVDQFEELFRFKQSQSSDDATTFVKLLLEASAQQEIPIYIIITMRSDFLGDCSQFNGLPEAINNGQYLIPRMSRDERRSAIVGPIAVGSGEITTPLVSRLLNDVGDSPDQLPILQHALMRTWDYWSAHRRNGAPIGLADYTAIGTMAEALSRHADEAFNELDERNQLIAEKLFKRLTEKGTDNREIRRPTPLAELCAVCGASESEVSGVIDVFRGEGRSFLMPPAGTKLSSETVIDISHESLIRNWTRLQKWVDEEAQSSRTYRRLAEAAVLHREGSEGLRQDPALQIDLDWFEKNHPNAAWAQRYHPEFDEAKKYLADSCEAREAAERERERQRNSELERERREREQAQAYAEQQLRSAKRLRRFSFALVLISVLALAAAGGAVFAFAAAKRNEKTALSEKAKAEAAQKTAENAKEELKRINADVALRRDELQRAVNELKASEEDRKRQTEIAQERAEAAQIAEKKAEAETIKAHDREKEARAAQSLAESNAEQGQLFRESLESLQRQDYDLARINLEVLVSSISDTLKKPNTKAEDMRRLSVDLGWAHSHHGRAWFAMGSFDSARTSYETAQNILEKLGNQSQSNLGDPEPILYETYNGLGRTYQMIALAGSEERNGQPQKIDPTTYFKRAEDLYSRALKYHETQEPLTNLQLKQVEQRGIAEGHQNLARLYRDMGETDRAEQMYKLLIESDVSGPEDGNNALRELAEFYRDQSKYEQAVKAYNQLITEQEKFQNLEQDYERYGQEIANSYSELADVYRGLASTAGAGAQDKIGRADDAFALSVALQRFAIRLRRQFAAPDVAGLNDRDNLADAVADQYVRVGKLDRAVELYNYALQIRKTSQDDRRELPTSYDKLARLYSIQKDYAKAEQSYNELLTLYQNRTKGAQYANTLLALAAVYAQDANAAPEAATSYYQKALDVYRDHGDWYAEDLVLYRLAKLAEKDPPAARTQAMQNRVDALARYYGDLAAGKPIKDPSRLVTEYLQAINALAYSLKSNDPAAAATAYQRAFDMRSYVLQNFKVDKDEKLLKFYAAVLGDYQTLLSAQKNPLAAEVSKVAQGLRDDLNRNEEQKLTKTAQAATSQSAP